MARKPDQPTTDPKTLNKGKRLMNPEQLKVERAKQQAEKGKKELKEKLLKSGGYLS